MKGQIFLAVSLLIAIVLITAKLTATIPSDTAVSDIDDIYKNIKSELQKTAEITLLNQESLSENFDEFILFNKEIYEKRGYTLDITYLLGVGAASFDFYISDGENFIKDKFNINTRLYS